jgi:hypothetical protein
MATKTRSQQKFLLDRLQTIRNSKPSRYEEVQVAVPAKVKQAKRQITVSQNIVNAHNNLLSRMQSKRYEKVVAFYMEVKQLILFGDAKSVIKALDKFENTKF